MVGGISNDWIFRTTLTEHWYFHFYFQDRLFSSPNSTILKTIDYYGQIYALYQEERPHPLLPLTKFGKCSSDGECKIDSPVDVGENLGPVYVCYTCYCRNHPGFLLVYWKIDSKASEEYRIQIESMTILTKHELHLKISCRKLSHSAEIWTFRTIRIYHKYISYFIYTTYEKRQNFQQLIISIAGRTQTIAYLNIGR